MILLDVNIHNDTLFTVVAVLAIIALVLWIVLTVSGRWHRS